MFAQKKTPMTHKSGRAFLLFWCVDLQTEAAKKIAKKIATTTEKHKKHKNHKNR